MTQGLVMTYLSSKEFDLLYYNIVEGRFLDDKVPLIDDSIFIKIDKRHCFLLIV